MLPARRQVRGFTVASALVAALALATFACSDGKPGPAEPGAAFVSTPDLDRVGRRIVVARNAVAAYRAAGEITQQSVADQLRRRLNEAHEGVARNRVADALLALNRFIANVTAETPASISPSAAAALIAHARDILAMLGGSAGNQPPAADITAPQDGATFDVGDAITFTGTCTDPEDGDLTGDSCAWSSSIDGDIGTGPSFMVSDLSAGTHTITLTATDSDGATDTDQITITVEVVTPENQPPAADITAPQDGATFDVGDAITFTGTGTDPEDGDLTGAALVWTSSIDGQIGTGASFVRSDLSAGTHTITLTATDSDGATDTDQITITVEVVTPENQPPTADITAPQDGATFDVGAAITFTGTGTDPEDGDLTGAALVWTSSIDGQIGTGTSFMRSDLSAGTHTITLTATDAMGATGADRVAMLIEDETGGPPETLACGDLIPDSLTAAAQVNTYSFSGQAGDLVLFTIGQTAGFANARSRVTIVAPSGKPEAVFDGNGQIRVRLAEGGSYTVRVNANNFASSGKYSIGRECLSPLGRTEGTLDPGALFTQTIVAGEVDLYSFSGQTGDLVLLTLGTTGGFPNARSRLTVITPSGATAGTVDGPGQLRLRLAEDGTYVVHVNANNLASAGTYGVGLERLIPLGPTDNTLDPGALYTGAITAAEVDLYAFTGRAGDLVLLTLGTTSGFPNARSRLTVISPSGAMAGTVDGPGQLRLRLTEDGTHVVHVNANNLVSAGTYSLGFESLIPLGPTDGTLAQGTLFSSGITAAEVDVYSFTGQPGDIVLLTLAATAGFPNARVRATVIAPSGSVAGVLDGNAQLQLSLQEAGPHVVYVNANNVVSAGSYSISRN